MLGRTDIYASAVRIDSPHVQAADRFTPLAWVIREHETRGREFPTCGDSNAVIRAEREADMANTWHAPTLAKVAPIFERRVSEERLTA